MEAAGQSQQDALINAGINELKAGNKGAARQLLGQAVQTNPRSERAWLYLSATLPPEQAIESLQQVLALNPQNKQALRAIQALNNHATAVPGPGDDIPTSVPPALRPQPFNPQNTIYQPPNESQSDYVNQSRPELNQEQAYSPYAPQPTERNGQQRRYGPPPATDQYTEYVDEPSGVNPFMPAVYSAADSENGAARSYEPFANDDLRAVLSQPYVLPRSRPRQRSSLPLILGLLLLMLVVGVSAALYFLILTPPDSTTQATALPTAVANVLPTIVPATATVAATVFPTPTEEVPTPTQAALLLATATPLPPILNVQVVQGQLAKLSGFQLTISSYDNHSANFANQGAGNSSNGTHYEGVVVVIENTYNKVLAISPKLFQAIDGRNNYAAAIDGGRLPSLDVTRLQPGERRAAWLTFQVGDGTTLRAVTFSPTNPPDDKNTVLVNLVAPIFKGNTPVASKSPALTETATVTAAPDLTPAPAVTASDIAKTNILNKVALTVLAYNPAPNVHPFILPANYHYEAVQVRIENTDPSQDISVYLKTYPFELRDANGYVYTIGPLALDGPDHFDTNKFTAAPGSKTPTLTKLSGIIYFLVRDEAKSSPRTLVWYEGQDLTATRVEISLK